MSNTHHIPFHKPTLTGGEDTAVVRAIQQGIWAKESKEAQQFFESYYSGSKCFFTNSCSSALEMAVRSLGMKAGDEIIIPGFAYLAVANAVVNNGAKPVFADVLPNGNLDVSKVVRHITASTRAIIAIHYAGNAFDIDALLQLCRKHNLYLIEDAAQSIGSSYNDKWLGSFGHLACISFDYMKNVSCGQGGLLILNDHSLLSGVQTVYDNGSNRHAMLNGTRNFFDWAGKGNNSQINPLSTYFLDVQLKALDEITEGRLRKWNLYKRLLNPLQEAGHIKLPQSGNKHNGHIFYIVTRTETERNSLRAHMRENNIFCEHHYSSLAESPYGKQFQTPGNDLHNAELLCHNLLRLPLYHEMSEEQVETVAANVEAFYVKQAV